ncbi:MAG: DUF5717 family protein [Defluviitaleaceae bacterium]|nr:DUF5717 family protein [Defluviitaleaceae bacterium]MCL2836294.1 DUF5717 family protein [Defluviitaleaceae bacterium]
MDLTRELLEQYEYSLPVIKADKSEIRLETSRDARGSIELRNSGGGALEGSVASNLPALAFAPKQFAGNKARIEFKFNLGAYEAGDVIDGRVFIVSNGGELILPVHITITSRTLTTDDGTALSTLEDFLAYTQANAPEAARTFARKDFGEWLLTMPGNVNLELYEHFKFDSNKERAVDNFLICHGLKRKSELALESSSTDIQVIPGQKDGISGVIGVRRCVDGFVEAAVSTAGAAPWLRLITNRLTASSFDKNGVSCIDYVINPLILDSRRVMADVAVKTAGGQLVHRLFVRTLPVMSVSLNKNAYVMSDTGKVMLENNTGGDLVVEIMPKHDFMKFEGKRYLIGARADIPFEIKLTPQKLALLADRDVFYARTEIMVKTVYGSTVFTRALELGVSTHKGF